MHSLAYIPFINPINAFHVWWFMLLVPMALGISMVYKALKLASLEQYWRQVTMMTVQILIGMAALAGALVILVQLVIPAIPVP
jgi:hypothetical protein